MRTIMFLSVIALASSVPFAIDLLSYRALTEDIPRTTVWIHDMSWATYGFFVAVVLRKMFPLPERLLVSGRMPHSSEL
jgi:hypothetical protein